MNEINTNSLSDKNNLNSKDKNQVQKNLQPESQNKNYTKEKFKIKLPNKKDLSNEILYFSINQESK